MRGAIALVHVQVDHGHTQGSPMVAPDLGLHQALQTLQDRFDAQLLIYLAGADPHEGDRLGRLKLTMDGMQARDRVVMDWAWQRRLPLVLCMGGGYGHDIETTVQVQMQTWDVALGYWQRWHNLGR